MPSRPPVTNPFDRPEDGQTKVQRVAAAKSQEKIKLAELDARRNASANTTEKGTHE